MSTILIAKISVNTNFFSQPPESNDLLSTRNSKIIKKKNYTKIKLKKLKDQIGII